MFDKKSKIFALIVSAILCAHLFYGNPAGATEFAHARVTYLVSGVGYVESGETAAQMRAANICRGCVGTYTGPYWLNGQWIWQGTYHTPANPSVEMYMWGAISAGCPSGWYKEMAPTAWPIRCYRNELPIPPCDECDRRKSARVGNPIVLNGGVKVQTEVDYESPSGNLRFVRTYRSDDGDWRHNYQIFGIDFNKIAPKSAPEFACFRQRVHGSSQDYCFAYAGKGTPKSFGVRRGAGRLHYFGNDVDYVPTKDINDRVTSVVDGNGTIVGWEVTNAANDSTEMFGLDGRVQRITERNGRVTTFTYSDINTPVEIAPRPGYLLQVEDAFGKSLKFTYDTKGQMATMLDPAGNITSYDYDSAQNLSKVTYPDGKSKTYIYDEPSLTSNLTNAHLLTGIIDENGKRFATFSYYSDRRGKSTEHAGAVEKYSVTFPTQVQASVTDPLNSSHSYYYSNILGVLRLNSVARPSAAGTGVKSASTEYDANANIARYTDYDGTVTAYTYDLSRNLETQRIEASGTAMARTIQTEWHSAFRLPARVSEPLRRTTYAYDSAGNMLTKTIQATTDTNGAAGFNATLIGEPQVWTYTYDNFGRVLTTKGPRSGVNATTTFTYDDQGNLSTETNAAGHVTTYSNYDANGRAGRITDPNGLITDISYTPRGWISAMTVGGETTSYDYDGAGQITQVTLPDGSAIYNTYDDAHRLTNVRDTLGNSITYVLDNMGNRISEQSKDTTGALTRQITRAFNGLNRLKQVTGAVQ